MIVTEDMKLLKIFNSMRIFQWIHQILNACLYVPLNVLGVSYVIEGLERQVWVLQAQMMLL